MKKEHFIVTLIFAGVSPILFAQTANPCVTQNSTFENNACAQQKVNAQDLILNRAYQTLLLQLASYHEPSEPEPSARRLLIAAQRKWIEFRESDCKAKERIHGGGSIHTVIYLDCIREHTEQRIKDLNPMSWQAG